MVSTRTAIFIPLLLWLSCIKGGDTSAARAKLEVVGKGMARAGQDVSLACLPEQSGDLPNFYIWYKDGKTIPSQTGLVLRLLNVSKQNEGFYQCGGPGNIPDDKGLRLHVFVPGDTLPRPDIQQDRTPVCGSDYSLYCVITENYTANEETVFTWYKDYAEVEGQTGQVLSFSPLTEADEGKYTCTAREGPVSSTSLPSQEFHLSPLGCPQLTIKTPATDPAVEGILGAKLTLICKITAAGFPIRADGYSWSFLPSPQGQQRPLAEKSGTLTLGPLSMEDRGQYFCQAWNDEGNTDLRPIGIASVIVEFIYLENISPSPNLKVAEDVQLIVLCNQATGEPGTAAPDLSSELEATRSEETPWRDIAAVTSSLLGIIMVVVTLVIYWCRLNKSQRKQLIKSLTHLAGCPWPERGDYHEMQHLLDRGQRSPAPSGNSPQPKENIGIEVLYQNGEVLVLPPVEDFETKNEMEEHVSGEEDGEAMASFVQTLQRSLKTTVRPEDPPVFIIRKCSSFITFCTVFHQSYGVVIMYLETDEKHVLANPQATIKNLLELRRNQRDEMYDKLNPEDVSAVLVLPNLSSNDLQQKIQEKLQKHKIQVLCGKEETDIETWLQGLDSDKQPWALKSAESKEQAFKKAVQKYLIVKSYGAKGDPSSWLPTQEEASVSQSINDIIHVWGPPGSGKSLLLLDKVRWWLSGEKTVLLVAKDPSFEPQLHRLASLAVMDLPRDAEKRLLLCTDAAELEKAIESQLKKRKSVHPCIVMDNIDADFLPELLQLYENNDLAYLWTTGHEDISQEDVQKFQAMGGRSFRLTNSFRCTGAILELANQFLPSQTTAGNLNTLPCLAARPPVPVKVAYHPRHSAYRAQVPDCGDCQAWLRRSLSLLKYGLTMEDERWKGWVILLTGDWGSDTNAKQVLRDQLRRQGVPAVLDRKLNSQLSSKPYSDTWFKIKPGKAAALERAENGVDTKGHPAVHMVPATSFRGLEIAYVLVVHYDWRDDHPDHQSQESRDARLAEHRQQLHVAVTRCQTELAVLLLSPSPAAHLLMRYTSDGEQHPADAIVEMEIDPSQ